MEDSVGSEGGQTRRVSCPELQAALKSRANLESSVRVDQNWEPEESLASLKAEGRSRRRHQSQRRGWELRSYMQGARGQTSK